MLAGLLLVVASTHAVTDDDIYCFFFFKWIAGDQHGPHRRRLESFITMRKVLVPIDALAVLRTLEAWPVEAGVTLPVIF